MMRVLGRELAATGGRGVALAAAALFALLVAGPRAELAFAPPVSLFEIERVTRDPTGVTFWIVSAQARDCAARATWTADGAPAIVSGPPLTLARGEAEQIGPFHIARPASEIAVAVRFDCGMPWSPAPIRKTAAVP